MLYSRGYRITIAALLTAGYATNAPRSACSRTRGAAALRVSTVTLCCDNGEPASQVKPGRTGRSRLFARGLFSLDDEWNADQANQLLRVTLDEIELLGDKLSPARAEALLDEFEHDIREAFLRRDLSAVVNNCEKYGRRFRALGEEEE